MALKKYFKPTFLLLCIFLWGLFTNLSYSQPTLVLGDDEDALGILIHTKYLDGTPVLIFASQNAGTLMTSQQLKSINNFVFVDKDLKEEKQFFNESHAELSYIFKKRTGSFSLSVTPRSAYLIKILVTPSREEVSENPLNNNIIRIDNEAFGINDFVDNHEQDEIKRKIFEKVMRLGQGMHHYEFLRNPFFNIQWIIIEPYAQHRSSAPEKKWPSITFHRINPTKYLINVREASGPFWLVFSEAHHPAWKVYKASPEDLLGAGLPQAVTEYKNIGVKEMRADTQFTPRDIKYLFSDPLPIPHFQVNNYANGWYVDPKNFGSGTNFDLVLYFYPQSLFYLGFFITLLTLFTCCFWQGCVILRNIVKGRKNARI
jgi:hypothetical protein